MVDRIKFSVDNVEIDQEILAKKFFKSAPNKKGNVTYTFKNNFIEDDEEEDSTDETSETEKSSYDRRYKKYLYIKYIRYKIPKKLPQEEDIKYEIRTELIIHRNIRKDRLGDGRIADISYIGFAKTINKYAQQFKIQEKKMWSARVTKIELGVTLRLKENMKGILSCFQSFKDLPEKNIYSDNGISFIGTNYSVSFYDKIERMDNNKELFPNSKNKKKLKAKMTENNYFLRLELKVEKVSGFYKQNFKGKLKHLVDIKNNWDYLCLSIAKLYYDVGFIDVLSLESRDSINGEERTPMNNYLKFKGIQLIGKDIFFEEILPLMKEKGLPRFRKEYRKFYDDYERKFRYSYKDDFKAKLDEKVELLMRKV
jgi:hypothetical protein